MAVQVTAAGVATEIAITVHARPPSVLFSRIAVPFGRRAVARHHRAEPHETDVKVCRPCGTAAARQRTPPSTDRAAAATPPAPVPTTTQSAGFAHDAAVATASPAGSVERCVQDAPLFVVRNTAVSVVAVTRARQRPGATHVSAETPEPGGCDAVVEATLRAGLTITSTDPDGPAPPRRQPDDQHPAAVNVVDGSGGVAAGAHFARPPADTSIDAVPVDDAGFVPPATHHARGSQASTDRTTEGTVAA